MAGETGVWSIEGALEYHDFCYKLAKHIGDILSKDEVVIDFGCGRATLLRYLHDRGFKKLYGIEGTDFPAFEYGNISVQDLTQPFTKDSIGNSVCLEVGEHIPQEYTDQFIKNITQNTNKRLILSWAIPGQAGIGHVNCKHNIWVISRLETMGFKLNVEDTLEIRQHVDNHTAYFRDTLLIFDKI